MSSLCRTGQGLRLRAWFATLLCCASSAFAVAAEKALPPYQLENGLTVLLNPLTQSDQVAVVVVFSLGNAHDPVGKSGRAHLLEHLYATSATDSSAARDVNQIVQRYGHRFNMQTGYDYTVIAGTVGTDAIEDELEDAASRMASLRVTQEDLEREVPRMLLELRNMYGGVPALAGLNHVRNRLLAVPAGGRYGGVDEHLEGMGVDELQDAWRDYYKPNNAILAVAGGFDVAEIRDAIERHFGSIPIGKPTPRQVPERETRTGTVARVMVSPVTPHAAGVVAIGYAAPQPGSELYAPFLVVVSRLWAEIGGRLQPGKPPPVYYPPLDDSTVIILSAEWSDTTPADSVLDKLDDRLQSALTAKVTRRDRRRTANSMATLGTVDVPNTAWRQNVYGLAFSTARRLQLGIDGVALRKAIEKTTDADMRRLGTSVFAPSKRVAVVIEPEEE